MSLELLMGWSVCGVSYLGSHGGQIGFLSTVFSAVLDFRWKIWRLYSPLLFGVVASVGLILGLES